MHFSASVASAILAFSLPAAADITQSFSTPATTPSPTFALAHGGALDIAKPQTSPVSTALVAADVADDLTDDHRWHSGSQGSWSHGSWSHGGWHHHHTSAAGSAATGSAPESPATSEPSSVQPVPIGATTASVQPVPIGATTASVQPIPIGTTTAFATSAGTPGSPASSPAAPESANVGHHTAGAGAGGSSAADSSAASVTTAAPVAPDLASGHSPLTFEIVNQSPGISITISYQLNTYINPDTHATSVAPALNAPASTGVFATATTVVAPFGWAGRMTIGKAGAPLDYRGTKIEGNNGFTGGNPDADLDPDIDVSYVDGFSLPAVCGCGNGAPTTGCNKPLFHLGNTCSNVVGDSDHPVCVNMPRNAHGPATPFFAPCAGAAYTFDYDDGANWQGACPGNVIKCCIGPSCQAPTRQPTSNSKREVMGVIAAGLS